MINWLNGWVQGIILAVIIATIIEMILPKGNNKKYIKTVIGVYILFTIIHPIITKVTGKEINLKNIIPKQETTVETSYTDMSNKLIENTNKQAEETYINSLKEEIKSSLEKRDYIVSKIELQIETKDESKYGEIKQVYLNIAKKEEDQIKSVEKIEQIEEIKIGERSEKAIEKIENKMSEENLKEIEEILKNSYQIEKEKIKINL